MGYLIAIGMFLFFIGGAIAEVFNVVADDYGEAIMRGIGGLLKIIFFPIVIIGMIIIAIIDPKGY